MSVMPEDKSYTAVFPSPVGYLGIQMEGKKLKGLEFLGKHEISAHRIIAEESPDEASVDIGHALKEYFNDPFSIKSPRTVLSGTVFQKKVWQVLSSIKAGETRTYGDIARQLNSSPRAIGNACRNNPVPIFIPCHRVVSVSGRGGFMGHSSGEPLAIKEWLLTHEQKPTTGK